MDCVKICEDRIEIQCCGVHKNRLGQDLNPVLWRLHKKVRFKT